MISVVILTKNEELCLPRCLKSVEWSDDVHVLDSGSTDRTCEISREFGVKLCHNPFESFGKQRNYALDFLDICNEWVLFLDADEVVTQKFHEEILEAVKNAKKEVAGFYCCWKMMLEDRWLKHSDNFPKWQFRLLRKGNARFTDFGHGQKEYDIKGYIEYIKEPYLHYSFSKGWFEWVERHNNYSSKEAAVRLYSAPPLNNLFSRHSSLRNPALKSLLSRFPGFPILRFVQTYFFNLGFLEGVPALNYCIIIAYQEFMIQLKMRELRRAKKFEIKTINTINNHVISSSLAKIDEMIIKD